MSDTTQSLEFDILDVQGKDFKREVSARNCLTLPLQLLGTTARSVSTVTQSDSMSARLVQLLGPAATSSPNCFGSSRSRQQDCLDGPTCSAAPSQAMAAPAVSLLGNKAVSTALWLGCNKLQSFLQIFHQVASTKTWSMPLHMTSISLTSWRINIHYNATLVGLILAHSCINSKSGQ